MNKETILGFVRHVLTFGGGFLSSGGFVTGEQLEIAVGAIITLAGIIWSAIDKKQRA